MFKSKLNIEINEERYSAKNTTQSFIHDIERIYNALNQKRILLILDEIESISFTTSPSKWWREEEDALYFWQVIRTLIQMNSDYLSFVFAGVNPMCVEMQSIKK